MVLGQITDTGNLLGVVSPVLLALAGWAFRHISQKIDQVGMHLERQDTRGRRQDQRLVRLEEHAGLHALPPAENGVH